MIKDETMEEEANMFACLLLMPKKFIEEDLKTGFDIGDDSQVKDLCKKYQVSLAMLIKRVSIYEKYGM